MTKGDKPKIESKFAGEAFGLDNVRTVFASASEDNVQRDDRVIVLIGPASTGKSTLIDCFCNYFYGSQLDGKTRYKIADEIFDHTTPMKAIIRYIFNETGLPYRPIVIDTPGIGSASGVQTDEEISAMLASFLSQSHKICIHAICLVLRYDDNRVSVEREKQIKETLSMFPKWMMPNIVPLLSASDRTGVVPAAIKMLLKNLGLSENKCFFFNSGSLFDMSETDPLSSQLRKTYWDLTMTELESFFEHVATLNPQCIAEELPPGYKVNGGPNGVASAVNGFRREEIDESQSFGQKHYTTRESPVPSHIDKDALKGVPHKYPPYDKENRYLAGDGDEHEYSKQSSMQTKSLPYFHYEMSSEQGASRPVANYTSPSVQTRPPADSNGYMQSTTASTSTNAFVESTLHTSREKKSEEHYVPIRLIDQNQRWSLAEPLPPQETPAFRRLSRDSLPERVTERNSGNEEVIKRYIYDPTSMTHKELLVNLPKRSSSRISNASITMPKIIETPADRVLQRPHRFTETLIDDVPSENLDSKSSSEPEAGLHYTHVKSSPPPAYTPKQQKPLATLATGDSPSKDTLQNIPPIPESADAAPPQVRFSRSAVQRQIVKRSPSKDSPTEGAPGITPSPTVNARSSWTYRSYGDKEPKAVQDVATDESGVLPRGEAGKSPISNSSSLRKQPSSPLRIRPSVLRRAFEQEETEKRRDDAVEQPRLLETNIDDLAPTSYHDPLEGASSRLQSPLLRDEKNQRGVVSPRVPVFETVQTVKTTTRGAPIIRPRAIDSAKQGAPASARYDLPPEYDEMGADAAQKRGLNRKAPNGGHGPKGYEPVQTDGDQVPYMHSTDQLRYVEAQYPPIRQDRDILLKSPMVDSPPTAQKSKAGHTFLKCCFLLLIPLFIILVITAILLTLFLS